MNDPKCPFCGETMTASAPFYDKYGGKYTSYAKCGKCGAQGPLAKSNASIVAENRAIKNALKRPKQRPLRWAATVTMQLVYLEDVDKDDIIPAFNNTPDDKGVMHFITADLRNVCGSKSDYGKRWRAWASPPTSNERKETEWRKG